LQEHTKTVKTWHEVSSSLLYLCIIWICTFAGGSMATYQARRQRNWYWKRGRMEVSWFESPRANLETMYCQFAQMTGSLMSWYAARYRSPLNVISVFFTWSKMKIMPYRHAVSVHVFHLFTLTLTIFLLIYTKTWVIRIWALSYN
jgi:hypothetical protein